ncbi:MAG TPA: M64 family metallopeptidase [Phycisphaerales bacterium]|jgi:hypothetical protein|nr:M64 family metallopeptidase [Phycisphaerales bacterium]
MPNTRLLTMTGLAAMSIAAGARAESPGTELLYYDGVNSDGTLVGGVLEVAMPVLRDGDLALRGTSETIWGTGPSSNRIDIALVGDGYTAGQLGTYGTQAQNVTNALFGEEPFTSYGGLFLVHRVDVVSNESGVDNDPSNGIDRDTAMDMGFWCNGIERLLCIDVSKAVGFAGAAPAHDQILALANSTMYGGAGYSSSNLGTVSGGNGSAFEVAIHELGHSFGDLADEYTYGGGTDYPYGEPSAANISIQTAAEMASSGTKWAVWLGFNDPQWDGLVDTFEGAAYYTNGVYRPTNNSKMRALGRPFNPPSVEAFILEMYAIVDPLDDWTPTGPILDGSETILAQPVEPGGHDLTIIWLLDGSIIAGQTAPTIDLSALNIPSGTHTLAVIVRDDTPWVRDEAARSALMTRSLSWTIEASQPCPGDLDGNGVVSVNDLLAVVDAYGTGSPSGDANGDGIVNTDDILIILGGWGPCP